METKTTSGNIEDVENQCCRGGASLIAAARQMIGDLDPDAASSNWGRRLPAHSLLRCSCTDGGKYLLPLGRSCIANEVVYHMQMIESFILRELDTAIALHHAIDNILYWGVDEREIYIKGVLHKIAEWEMRMGGKERKKNGEGDE